MVRPLWKHSTLFSSRVWMVFILLMSAILLAGSTACGIGKSAESEYPPDSVVSDFLQLLNSGFVHEALNRMDPDIWSEYTSDCLDATNLMIGNLKDITQTGLDITGDLATVEINITFVNDYAEEWVFYLERIDGEWLISEWLHPSWLDY